MPEFRGTLNTSAARDRRVAGLLVVLLVAFVGIAIAKPWSAPSEPAPSVGPSQAEVAPSAPSLQTTAPETPSAAPLAVMAPLPVAFTTPLPLPTSSTWSGLRWRRLAPDDPLGLVRSVLRWRGGFIAVGWEAVPPRTPVWTSADGRHWEPLVSGTSTTFWPGFAVLGVAEGPTGLVALTEAVEYCSQPCTPTYVPLVVSWTSADGHSWKPHPLFPAEWLASPTGSAPLVAVGPAGLVVASTGLAARLATSTDGANWRLAPAAALPARFALNDLDGTATGYVAVGRGITPDARSEAASFWSSDGRQWSKEPTLLPATPEAGLAARSDVTALVVGPDGIIAVGSGVTTLGATLWWQSRDGRRWAALPTWPPLGTRTPCGGEGCGLRPHGALVGDGNRMVALRGGDDAGAWTSSDGLGWQRLPVAGDIPAVQATQAVLLPSGVLLSDGTTTWFGEVLVR